jgi:hypothetical protein
MMGIKTVTCVVAVNLRSAVMAVTVARPSATPVTNPVLLTVAIEELLDDQRMDCVVAFTGVTVATRVALPFTRSDRVA